MGRSLGTGSLSLRSATCRAQELWEELGGGRMLEGQGGIQGAGSAGATVEVECGSDAPGRGGRDSMPPAGSIRQGMAGTKRPGSTLSGML